MKFLFVLTLLVSVPAFANLKCSEPNSTLDVKYFGGDKISVILEKNGKTIFFKGAVKPSTKGSHYFKVTEYNLKGSSTIKISAIPIMSRVPPCMGRVCNPNFHRVDYSAELTYEGQATFYDCKEIF